MSEQAYRLPCPCGHVLHVVPEQAGTDLTCPQCGAAVRVPSLQEMRRLEVARALVQPVPNAAASASRSRLPWPIVGLGAVLLLLVAAVLWVMNAPSERAGAPAADKPLADSAETPDRLSPTGQTPPVRAAPTTGPPSKPLQARPGQRDTAAAASTELLPVEYIDLVDFGALTHSQEPVGAVLIKLARLVEERISARDLSQRMAQAYQVQLLQEQLELPDRRLGEPLRLRRLADRFRDRVQEESVVQTATDETRRGLTRLIEVSEALQDPERVRAISVETFRRRIGEQYEQLSDAPTVEELSEGDKELAARRAKRLEDLKTLPDDDLIEQYAHWIFREGWVQRAAEQIRDQHRRLSERFQVSASEVERLLEGDETAFRAWVFERRPEMIRRDLKSIVAMHKKLLAGDLNDAGQSQLRELCVRWNVDPTEAPKFLRAEDAPMTKELEHRAATRMREDLAQWLRLQFGATPVQGLPTLEEVAERYQIEPDVEQIKELVDASEKVRLEKHQTMVANGWRRALEQLVDLERTVQDTEKLESTALEDAGRTFREFLQHNINTGESLLLHPGLPESLRPALEEVSAELKALLEHDDRQLLETCDQAVRLRLLPGTTAELLEELDGLKRLYACDRTKAQQLLDARDETDLKQVARDATVRHLREELKVLAQGGTGSGTAEGAGVREALREKYGIHGADARRLLAMTDEEVWQWNLGRMADVSKLPDEEVVAQAAQILPEQLQSPEEPQPSLEELGGKQREEIKARLEELKRQFTVSLETGARTQPLSQSLEEIGEAERVQRGLLQPFFQPYSRFLSESLADLLGEHAADDQTEFGPTISQPLARDEGPPDERDATQASVTVSPAPGQDVATLFPQDEPAPAWVGLLRNGLLQARFAVARGATPARLTLFLPAEAEQLSAPQAAQRAFDRWYGVARLIVRWALRNTAPRDSLSVRVFAFLNEYETGTLWLNPASWETELKDAPPPKGKRPIDLESWREFLAESRLEGLRVAEAETDPELVLVGRRVSEQAEGDDAAETAVRPFTLLGRPVELQDLAVAYRAVLYGGHNDPYQSLDASRHPALANANFGGDLEDTRLGKVLLDADLTFKFLTSGLDPFTGESRDRRSEFQQICESRGLPPFEPAYDQFANAKEGTEMLQVTRFWLKLAGESGGEGVRFDWRASPMAVEVVHPFFLAEARKHVADGRELPVRDLPPWTRQAIDHLNQHREAYEEIYPVLEEVRSVGLLQALCLWMQNEGIDQAFDLDELLDEPTDYVPTPRTRLRGVFASVVDVQGNVQSFNCSDVARRLQDRSLELVADKHFESFAYVAAASLALARKWAPENPAVSQAYEGIYSQVMDALADLYELPETEATQAFEQFRSELYNVAQQRWMVGCAWTTTGGIDLTVPPARRGRIDLSGRHSSRRRSGSVTAPRRGAQPGLTTKRPRSASPAKPTRDSAKPAPEKSAPPAARTGAARSAAPRTTKPNLKLLRRGKRIRLQRRSGSRYSIDF